MNKDNLLITIILSLIILLALTGVGFIIYVYVRYSNVPLKDLPAWVLPFFLRR